MRARVNTPVLRDASRLFRIRVLFRIRAGLRHVAADSEAVQLQFVQREYVVCPIWYRCRRHLAHSNNLLLSLYVFLHGLKTFVMYSKA